MLSQTTCGQKWKRETNSLNCEIKSICAMEGGKVLELTDRKNYVNELKIAF